VKRYILGCVVVLVVAVGAAMWSPIARAQVGSRVQLSEKTTPIACPERMMVFAFPPTADRIAFVCKGKPNGRIVSIDSKTSESYDDLRPIGGKQAVLFSNDGKRNAFVAKRGGSWIVVVDGKDGPAMDSVDPPAFSADGSTVAYGGEKDGKPVLVIDTAGSNAAVHELPGLPASHSGPTQQLALSPDLRHWAYVAMNGESGEGAGERTVMLDGKQIGEKYASVAKPVFSPDCKRCGFLAKTNKPQNGDTDEWVVIDGKKFGPWQNLVQLVFSPDSQHWAAIRNGTGGGAPVMPGTPQDRAAVVRDGKLEGAFDAIEAPLVFSPNSARLAFVIDSGSARACVVDGKAGPTFQNAHPPLFSPDSKHVAYVAETSQAVNVILDDTPGPGVRDVNNEYAILFSPDSRHLAYVATTNGNEKVAMLDNKPVGAASRSDVPNLTFSPDSAHLVAQGSTQGMAHIWIDGTPVKESFKTASPVVFDGNNKLHALIARSEKVKRQVTETFYRLDVEIR
jgi:WD40 repeat protein